jgi:ABC-type transport system involved in multi-copper enzyme maturation permease subunit
VTVFQEASLVAGHEMRRNLKSGKGLVLLLLCLLGGVAAALVMAWVHKMDVETAAMRKLPPEAIQEGWKMVLSQKYGDEAMGEYLSKAPIVLLASTFTGVWLAPLLVALVGFDSIPTDLQHRGVRYLTIRVQRASYYVGKVVALWVVVSAMMLLSQGMIWIVALVRGAATGAEVASWGPRFWLVTVLVAAAWCGIAQLVSSQFRAPFLALFVTFFVFCLIWIVHVIGSLSETLHALVYVYPNTYDGWLLSPHAERIALGCLICFGFMAATSAGGAVLFQRRDL